MAEPQTLRQRERELAVRARREGAERQARKQRTTRSGGQVLETYRGPDTLGGFVYDTSGKIVGGLNRLIGMSERDAARRGQQAADTVRSAVEFFVGPEELERSVQRIGRGRGSAEDFAVAGLTLVPLPKPVRTGAKKLAAKITGGAKTAAKAAKGTRAGRYLTESRAVPEVSDIVEGVARAVPEEMGAFAARPQQGRIGTTAGQPIRVKTPDEGDWELPDLDEDVSIETISSGPAIISKPKSLEAWHGTPHRFAAERRIVSPQGSETFVAGAPGVLPEAPAGFSVMADFPLGRFRSEKLGSGEGAQQYGIGTYLAENPDVARNYRSELTQDIGEPNIGGVPLAEYYDALQRRADAARNPEALYDRLSLIEDLGLDLDLYGVQQRAAQGAYTPEAFEWFNREVAPKYDAPGALYRVRGDIDPREMLSLDDPLAAQSEAVRNAVKNLDLSHLGEGHRTRVMLEQFLAGSEPASFPAGGQTLLSALADPKTFEHTPEGSRYLLGQGIPGIRYWDEGSREARRGTRNFVVFDPERDLQIVERYAVGGRAKKAPSLKVKK